MALKKLIGALGITAVMGLGAVAVGPTVSSAAPAAVTWVLHSDSSLPRHTVGTACTAAQADAYTLGRTRWSTVLGCGYYLRHNVLKAHWTYLWFATDGSNDVWTTDGWLYPGGHRPATYVGNIFATT